MYFTEAQQQRLLDTAHRSIVQGLERGEPLLMQTEAETDPLAKPGACFVTLRHDDQLRGCIGSLEACRPLIEDAAENAYAAAFRDPRFQPLKPSELPRLHLSLSVLSLAEAMTFASQADLLQQLRPGIDGLILQAGAQRGTFLPAVWESLPRPVDFLDKLKLKASLPANYWSDDIQVWRYTTDSFS
ncbi:COG2078: Uncharacterized ACR [hydrothermal vent metagenome]|uniref:COG2078: Uncharacterized ACR n=1 Tax=hydrothermal vent metagenome TaxID=652676 RepID=A0A3B0YCC6_9ZZZZ